MRDFAKFKPRQALWMALLAPVLFSCQPTPEQVQQSGSQTYVGLIIALDTLSTQERVLQTDSLLADLWARHDTDGGKPILTPSPSPKREKRAMWWT